jgi:tRNA threonylcarbamoyl adenosine modification protein YjeE
VSTPASTPGPGAPGPGAPGRAGDPVELSVVDAEAMEALGRELSGLLRAGDLVVLTGPLGAGKTTLTRGLGAGLEVRGQVASPTFVLARTHPTASGTPLVHVDAYRLSTEAELDDLDLDYEGSIVVVEWGAGLLDGVADSWLDVVIGRPTGARAEDAPGDPTDPVDPPDEPRRVTITPHGPRWSGVDLPTG